MFEIWSYIATDSVSAADRVEAALQCPRVCGTAPALRPDSRRSH
ncbi:MAG: hypothetical protein JO307_32915 [Bryobacterales bacterium]|nr:hypothetical protein [Bryobacterales bacterium]MBV9399217.1 hypothetical protein [Bryobacterales bacterium]